MNSEEIPYTRELTDVNVTEVYNKLQQILSKPSIRNSKYGKFFKENLEIIYDIFKENNAIDEETSHYNLHRLSIIKNNDIQWFTWFAYELLILPKPKLIIHLEDHLSNSTDKKKFLYFMRGQTMNFLSPIKLNYFQSNIIEVSIWVTNKIHHDHPPAENIDLRLTPDKSEPEVRAYFSQLSKDKYLSQEEVNHLVNSNFKYGEFTAIKKLDTKLGKGNLTYFIRFFFQNYFFNQENVALNISTFLRDNFKKYDAESKDAQKEKNLRKNLRDNMPKTYPF